MGKRIEIEVERLRDAVNAIFDHLIHDLGFEKVPIESAKKLYWSVSSSQIHDMSKDPTSFEVGDLGDDFDFATMVKRGNSADVSYNLIHIAPLLRYIAESVRK